MPSLTLEQREAIADRTMGGESPKSIARDVGVSSRTIYRLIHEFDELGDGHLIARPPKKKPSTSVNREQLMWMSAMMRDYPKITLREIRETAIEVGVFTEDDCPDQATIWRKLKSLGFKYMKPLLVDPSSRRDMTGYERCLWRSQQNAGNLDPTMLLAYDESNFYVGQEQPSRAWSTTRYKGAQLESKKGAVLRHVFLACIGIKVVAGKPQMMMLWKLVNPRRGAATGCDIVEEMSTEHKNLLKKLTNKKVEAMKKIAQIHETFRSLGIRPREKTKTKAMREELIEIIGKKTTVGHLKLRKRGPVFQGGPIEAPCLNARTISEFWFKSLMPFLKTGSVVGGAIDTCATSSDVGLTDCPSGGRIDIVPWPLENVRVLLDSAGPHLPPEPQRGREVASPLDKYFEELGLGPAIFLPPYSPWFNPIELFFAWLKRDIRRNYSPTTTAELVHALREVCGKLTPQIVMGFYRKAGYVIPGEEEPRGERDPNHGVRDRCSLPSDAQFQPREHVACFSTDGVLRKEKKTGTRKWSKFDNKKTDLRNLSVTKRGSVKPNKRRKIDPTSCQPPEDGRERYTGLFESEGKLEHAQNDSLIR